MKKNLLYVLVLVICFAIYPILRYNYEVFFHPDFVESEFFVYVRVLASGPLLFLCGIVLFAAYRSWIFGSLCIVTAIWWLALVARDLE